LTGGIFQIAAIKKTIQSTSRHDSLRLAQHRAYSRITPDLNNVLYFFIFAFSGKGHYTSPDDVIGQFKMTHTLDKDAFIKTLTSILDLTRLCGRNGYEYYTRDLLGRLFNEDIENFKKDLEYCEPTSWSLHGFSKVEEKEKLKAELKNLEQLMQLNGIKIKAGLFRQCRPLAIRLKQFD
jgi:hypothetical protein